MTAPTFTTGPATERLHHYAGLHWFGLTKTVNDGRREHACARNRVKHARHFTPRTLNKRGHDASDWGGCEELGERLPVVRVQGVKHGAATRFDTVQKAHRPTLTSAGTPPVMPEWPTCFWLQGMGKCVLGHTIEQ